ncbi:hypothetical protein N7449_007606 [Penicillium cf. viridicatum]|uniref:Uncharacterized protein n=1 Tax=Penicillium cf. viridicatum TaxID=2972119 RepID=A0A9W9JJH6_9EURO|nr:hypothetical protein N7449_007606 [Penicillium cf. viridicatum]
MAGCQTSGSDTTLLGASACPIEKEYEWVSLWVSYASSTHKDTKIAEGESVVIGNILIPKAATVKNPTS